MPKKARGDGGTNKMTNEQKYTGGVIQDFVPFVAAVRFLSFQFTTIQSRAMGIAAR